MSFTAALRVATRMAVHPFLKASIKFHSQRGITHSAVVDRQLPSLLIRLVAAIVAADQGTEEFEIWHRAVHLEQSVNDAIKLYISQHLRSQKNFAFFDKCPFRNVIYDKYSFFWQIKHPRGCGLHLIKAHNQEKLIAFKGERVGIKAFSFLIHQVVLLKERLKAIPSCIFSV